MCHCDGILKNGMTKYFSIVFFTYLFLPGLALAAYNDVTFTTSAIIQVGSYTLNVSGSSAVIQSIVVNPASFAVTLASGSSITISSLTLNQLSSDITSDVTSNICTGSASSLALSYSGGGTVTNTITPGATICSGSGSSPSAPVPTPVAPSGGEEGGGTVSPRQLVQILAPSASTTAYLVSRNIITLTFTGPLSLGSTNPDVTLLQELLTSLGFFHGSITGFFGPVTVQAVKDYQLSRHITVAGFVGPITRAALNAEQIPLPQPVTPMATSTLSIASTTFTRDLTIGSEGDDVKNLQVYLNSHGFPIAPTGAGSSGYETGYFGILTQAALARFQKANGITPAIGYFGPVTRAKLKLLGF
jgi:peptidoglycan hydrolase-like protein with peptidoglycan-binding domain